VSTTAATPNVASSTQTAVPGYRARFASFLFTALIVGVEVAWGLFLGYLVFRLVV
jgi:hypothetical protein